MMLHTVLILGSTGAAAAQTSEEAATLRITAAQFENHATTLELTEGQRPAAEAILADYEREFDDAWITEQALINWLWSNTHSTDWWGGESEEEFDNKVAGEARMLEERWQRGVREMSSRYFERLAAIAIGREDGVAALQRAHLRERVLTALGAWDPSGAETSLLALCEAFDPALALRPDVREVLDEYELALDRALLAHDELSVGRRVRIERARAAARAALAEGRDATEARRAQADVVVDFTRSKNVLRQLHASTASRIAMLIPQEQRPAFDDAVHAALRPFLRPEQGPTPEQAFNDALARTDPLGECRNRLNQLRSSWRGQRAAAVPALEQAYLRYNNPDFDRDTYVMIFSGQHKEASERIRNEQASWDEAIAPWRAACAQIIRDIDAVLAEQVARAPDLAQKPSPATMQQEATTNSWWDEQLALPMSASEFQSAAAALGFSAEQTTAASAALNQYVAESQNVAGRIRQRINDLGSSQYGWAQLHADWLTERLRLEAQLEEGIAAALQDGQQQAAWRKHVREVRCAREIRELRTARHRHACDLKRTAETLALSPWERRRVASHLDSYHAQLDALLVKYHDATIANARERMAFDEDRQAGMEDATRNKRLVDSIEKWLATVQDIERLTKEYARFIAADLDEQNQAMFLEALNRCAYPEAFTKCPVEGAAEALRLVPDIAPEKREAVEALLGEYLAPRDQIRNAILTAVERWENENPVRRDLIAVSEAEQRGELTSEERMGRTSELLRQHPANPLLQRRHDLAIDTVKRMRSVFTDDEIARLPLAVRLCLTDW
jgi:hypothetical protein